MYLIDRILYNNEVLDVTKIQINARKTSVRIVYRNTGAIEDIPIEDVKVVTYDTDTALEKVYPGASLMDLIPNTAAIMYSFTVIPRILYLSLDKIFELNLEDGCDDLVNLADVIYKHVYRDEKNFIERYEPRIKNLKTFSRSFIKLNLMWCGDVYRCI